MNGVLPDLSWVASTCLCSSLQALAVSSARAISHNGTTLPVHSRQQHLYVMSQAHASLHSKTKCSQSSKRYYTLNDQNLYGSTYRAHVIAKLPELQMLDGKAIGASEQQHAAQVLKHQDMLLSLMLTNACLVHKLVSPLSYKSWCFCC